jgi:hypothetical protein
MLEIELKGAMEGKGTFGEEDDDDSLQSEMIVNLFITKHINSNLLLTGIPAFWRYP